MAKKKQSKAAKKESPSKSESNSMGWIIAAIVVVVIIAFLVMKGGFNGVKTAEKPTTAAPEKGTLTTSTTPEFALKCLNAIGVVPGTTSVKNNVVSVMFKNNGRGGIEGSYFEFANDAGKTVYKKNADAVSAGATISYTVDLNQVASELGSGVKTFVIYPIENGKACKNQRRVVIADVSRVSA